MSRPPNAQPSNAFPLRISEIFAAGIDGFKRQPVPLLVGGLLTLAVYTAFGIPARVALKDGEQLRGVTLNLAGSILAGAAAYPWFVYALRIGRGQKAELGEPFAGLAGFRALFVCSFWFWAAFVLGFQYLAGIPSLVVLLFYCFYGFVVVDEAGLAAPASQPAQRRRLGLGLRALGTSVRLSQGRRVALFAILGVFAMFNFCALIPLGFGSNPVAVIASFAVFLATSSISMVGGAALYDAYRRDLPDAPRRDLPDAPRRDLPDE